MYDIVTIGSATRDVFVKSHLFKTVRDPQHLEKLGFPTGEAQCFALGSKISIEAPVISIGGGAANAAVTFARQKFQTAAVYTVGYHLDYGAEIMNDLKREGIRSFASFSKKAATSYSVILLSPSGERTILNYRGASHDLKPSDIAWTKLKSRWVYIVPGSIPFWTIVTIVKHFKDSGSRIALAPSKEYLSFGVKKLYPLLSGLDAILLNREEAANLTGVPYENETGIFKKFDELVAGLAVMTEGPKGVLVSDGHTIYRAGIFKERKIVDRTGAGDAFGSGFIAGLMKHPSPTSTFSSKAVEEAIRIGSANATAVVEVVGAQPGILSAAALKQKRFSRLPVQTRMIQ